MRASGRAKAQAGFSMPELMVGMIIMLVVISAVLSQVRSAFQVSDTAYEMTEAQQGVRFAQEYINRDLVSSGDGLRGINNIRVRENFVGTYLTTAPVTNPTDPNYITLPIITSDDNVAGTTAVAGTDPAVNVLGQTDRLTILLIDPNFAPISLPTSAVSDDGGNITITDAQFNGGGIQEGDVYFINSGHGATFATLVNIVDLDDDMRRLDFDNNDAYGLNLTGDNGALRFVTRGPFDEDDPDGEAVPASLMRMQMVHYFVNADGALIRRIFGVRGGAGFIDSTVAENVSNLQIRYFLGDAAQPVTQLATAPQQVAVRQVEVTVTVRTAHMLANGQRQSVSATTSTSVRNLQFRDSL